MATRAWYEEAFGADYLELYPRRTPEQAEAEAAFAAAALRLAPGDRVLDLACGPGFHLEALRARGLAAAGVDLSPALLEEARRRGTAVRGDLRLLPPAGPFAAVTTFFTTLGYFPDEGNERALAEAARVLAPGGRFLIDHLHPAHVRARLVPASERTYPGGRVRETRWLEEGPARVCKRVELLPDGGPVRTFTESVRLWEPEEWRELLARAGLALEAAYGSFAGDPAGPEGPRLILTGRKTAEPRPLPGAPPAPLFRQVAAGGDRNFSYLLARDGEAAAVDPAAPERILELAAAWGVRIRWILATHGHGDHSGGNEAVRRAAGATVAAHAAAGCAKDLPLRGGERLPLGGGEIEVLATPGHTPCSICFLWEGRLVTGDTLFVGKVGGTDLGAGAAAEHRSLHGTIGGLPPGTEVWPGHDVGVLPFSTVGREKATNPFYLQGSLEEFVALKREWPEYKRRHGIA